jgi:hypothetical protein
MAETLMIFRLGDEYTHYDHPLSSVLLRIKPLPDLSEVRVLLKPSRDERSLLEL